MAHFLKTMEPIRRIAIIGNAGSGKSTLARKLHTIFKLPVYHLDQYFWKPGWVEPNHSDYLDIYTDICEKESWIIDGMNLHLLMYRLESTDVIIFLDFPQYLCFWRILKRTIKYYGKETPSSAQGCHEKFDKKFLKFLKWVWRFKKIYRPYARTILRMYEDEKQIHILRSQKEVDQFLANALLLFSKHDKK